MKTISSLPDSQVPLRAAIINGVLKISIGIGTLAFAAEHDDNLGFTDLTVMNQAEFAKDVLRELNREAEDGSTLVTRVLDKAITNAIEDGSIAVKTEETDPDEDDFGDSDE